MFENKDNRTELSSLGEFGLIDHLTKHVKLTQPSTIKGIGDDAAILQFEGDQEVVVSTDMLVEGVHFDLMYAPLKHVGYKAVIVNLSDICAMNAVPTQVTVSIAVSNRFSLEAMEALYEGILLACERYKVDFVGGDTTSSVSGIVLSVTAVGAAKKGESVQRKGAKVNDLVVVTGDFGGAYMGLQILEREKQIFKENPGVQPDLEGNDYILERQLKPEARVDIYHRLQELNVKPSSMIDVSDGLSSEIMHICKHSEVGCTIYDEKLPIDVQTFERAREFGIDPSTAALNGGEDYELLMTVPLDYYDQIKNHPDFTIIGHITDKAEGCNLITRDGSQHTLEAQGWDQMKLKPEEPKKDSEEEES